MRRPVTFESRGLRLAGILAVPDRFNGRGVALVHGWSGYRIGPHRILTRTARRLNDAGFATLHFDLRGRGDSQGEYDHTDLDMMIEDTLNAARFLRAETGCGDAALLGICSGANVAIGAATLDHAISSVVAWSALTFQKQVTGRQRAASRRGALLTYLRKLFQLETWRKILTGRVNYRLVRRAVKGDGPAKGERNLKDSSRDILAELASYPGRILFIHGSKDAEGMVGREHFQEFFAGAEARAEFHLIEGANHSFYSLAWEREIVDRSIAFLSGRPER